MNYSYESHLQGKKMKGKIEATTTSEALRELQEMGHVVTHLSESKPWEKDIFLKKKLSRKSFIMFLRQYSTLVRAGIPIAQATTTMKQQTTDRILHDILEDIDKSLGRGEPLSSTMARYPDVFPALLVHMVQSGEASGKLDDVLEDMAGYYETQYRNRQKMISALYYPTAVMIFAVIATYIILVTIVPMFVDMFGDFETELPAYTKFVIALSILAKTYWWAIPVVALALIFVFKSLLKSERFSYQFDKFKLKAPVIGGIISNGAMARLTQTLSSLFNSSVPILQSLDITQKVIGNKVIEGVIDESKVSLQEGRNLSDPLINHWAFPPFLTQMIRIGEQTGSMDEMLERSAHFFEAELEESSERLKALVEPIMIVGLTVVVGGIVMAVVIPMFAIFESI